MPYCMTSIDAIYYAGNAIIYSVGLTSKPFYSYNYDIGPRPALQKSYWAYYSECMMPYPNEKVVDTTCPSTCWYHTLIYMKRYKSYMSQYLVPHIHICIPSLPNDIATYTTAHGWTISIETLWKNTENLWENDNKTIFLSPLWNKQYAYRLLTNLILKAVLDSLAVGLNQQSYQKSLLKNWINTKGLNHYCGGSPPSY